MRLTNVPEVANELIVVAQGTSNPRAPTHGEVSARGAVSPRAFACDGVVVVLGPRADGDASSPLGVVVAGVDRPIGLPWADPC